jgi:hypothetical protein
MHVETDGDKHITKILSVRQLKLAKCQKDASLPAP